MSVQFLWLSSVEWIKILEYWSCFMASLFCLYCAMTCYQEHILSCNFSHYNWLHLPWDVSENLPGAPQTFLWALVVVCVPWEQEEEFLYILPILLISLPFPKHPEVWFLGVNFLRPLCFAEHQPLKKDWNQTEIQKTLYNRDSTSQ